MALLEHLLGQHASEQIIWREVNTAQDHTSAQLRAQIKQSQHISELVGPKEVIAIDTSRGSCFETLAMILGVIEAGRVAMPLRSPQRQQLQDLGVAALLHTSAPRTLELAFISAQPTLAAPDTALILATSGSSGQPRHVMLSAQGIIANVDAILSYLPLRMQQRMGLHLPLHYSYGLIGQCFVALRACACVVELTQGPWIARQLDEMIAHQVTALSSVPMLLERLVGASELVRPQLELIASAGAPLPSKLVSDLAARFPLAALFNQYGMTEASPRLCATQLNPLDYHAGEVGSPLPGVTLEIDGAHEPGQQGPVIARSPALMLGYWQQPERTAQVLTARGLLTGDVGYLDARGRLYLSGRADDLIQIGGERVSLSELQARILAVEGVLECALELGDTTRTDARPCAFIVAPEHTEQTLRRALRKALAPTHRPGQLYLREALPLTPSGKLDRQALRHAINQRDAS